MVTSATLISSQGRVLLAHGPTSFSVVSGLASEPDRTTPMGGGVSQMEMLAVWQPGRHKCQSTWTPRGPGSSLSPRQARQVPRPSSPAGQPGMMLPRHRRPCRLGSVKCGANTCAGEAGKPRPLPLDNGARMSPGNLTPSCL